jgi:hypothetical protein
MSINKFKKQRGNSGIQTAITLLVGSIMLLGAVGAYQYIGEAKASNDITELSDLKNATIRYGQSVGVFTAANSTASILTSLNFFQASRVTGSGTDGAVIQNQWGGTITPSLGNISNSGDSLVYTYTAIPTSACRELVVKLDSIATAISIGGKTAKAAGLATVPAVALPLCVAGDGLTIAYTLAR